MIITSRTNPKIKRIKALREKKYRYAEGLYLVEGKKSVRECISAGCGIDTIVCTPDNAGLFPQAIVAEDGVFSCLSEDKAPQGVIAAVNMPLNSLRPPRGSCLLLDCLQDPGNLGTVIRTANAVGFEDIYLIDCADPYSPKCVRASMGGIFRVNVMCGEREEILRLIKRLPLICADMCGADIFSFDPPDSFCLCIGNEGSGISREILYKADYTVKIPMRPACESLNAGVSAGIAMYALANKLKYEVK